MVLDVNANQLVQICQTHEYGTAPFLVPGWQVSGGSKTPSPIIHRFILL